MGDSGGAVLNSRRTSWSMSCATGLPDVHTNLWSIIPWLRQATRGPP